MARPKKSCKEKQRLSAAERRSAIIASAIPLFASQGFSGVTTRMLAKEAGVSEALLYQHFPSKEILYEEVLDHCCKPSGRLIQVLESMTPSTEALVFRFFVLASLIIDPPPSFTFRNTMMPRLMMHSLAEDGAFARLFIARSIGPIVPQMESAFAAARQSGDLAKDGIPDSLRFWFTHHMLMGINLFLMPKEPVVDYQTRSAEELIDHAMHYLLRALGLKDDAIAKHYDYENLSQTLREMLNSEDLE